MDTTRKKSTAGWWKLLGKMDGFLVFFSVYFIYLLTTYPTVQTEDSGELIVAAIAPDIAHPPGYPLYILAGKLFSILIPFGNMAWRINIMSAFFGAASVMILYLLLKKILKNDAAAFCGSLFFAFTNLIWGQSNRAEVYTLNIFFLSLIVYLLYRWHAEEKKKWLYWAALAYGLSLADHHLMFLAGPAIIIFVIVRNWKVLIQPKTILVSILLFVLGLSVYAYIPIRTYLAPYDNPAFINHSGLYTWGTFINFVNRKIYGGTVKLDTGKATQEAKIEHLPAWILVIKDFFTHYGTILVDNNKVGLLSLLKIIFREYFFFPLFFFLPGMYFLYRKNWRLGLFVTLLFLCYTVLLLVFIPLGADYETLSYSSAEPFIMPVVYILGLISACGFGWFAENISNRKIAVVFNVALIALPVMAVAKNFSPNNESKNYIAYDFNRNVLESIPQNGYLITTGRDNMTFPLYYLRKIENIRKDIHLEVYYAIGGLTKNYFEMKQKDNGGKPIFIDLLPPDYEQIGLKRYNFVYVYGTDPSSLPPQHNNFILRGIRKDMDLNNNRLKGIYYIKMGLLQGDNIEKRRSYFDKVIEEITDNPELLNFVGDYSLMHGDYEEAIKAYKSTGNIDSLQKAENAINNPGIAVTEQYMTGTT